MGYYDKAHAAFDDRSFALDFDRELVVDCFAGAGGASHGIARAYRHPDIAINHNKVALAVHRANHPETMHFETDIFDVDPITATRGRPVGILWASPDCRHHSRAKGGKPRSKQVRSLAWVVLRWAEAARPRIIVVENVIEWMAWGPLDENDRPIKALAGRTAKAFIAALSTGLAADHPDMQEIAETLGPDFPIHRLSRGLGYDVEIREIVAADLKAPTIRKRMYMIARCDARPIVWPEATHHQFPHPKRVPWRTAAECIDFTLPACSVFATEREAAEFAKTHGLKKPPRRPLEARTNRRVAKGVWRHVLTNPKPYLVTQGGLPVAPIVAPLRGTTESHLGGHAVTSPLSTVAAQGMHHAVVGSVLTEFANASTQRTFAVDEPLRTQCANVKGGHFALASASLVTIGHGEHKATGARAQSVERPLGTVVAEHLTAFGENAMGGRVDEPMQTVLAGATRHGLVASHLTHLTHHDNRAGHALTEPFRTVTAANRGEQALVSACLVKYYSTGGQDQPCDAPMHTVPTKARLALVEVIQVRADLLPPEQRARAKQCAAFLHKHLPEHFPVETDLVLVGEYVLIDLTLRMLVPRELARAQGFPEDYYLDRGVFLDEKTGKPVWRVISKTDQVRLIGNSVCPDVAEAIVRANAADLIALYERMAA